MSSIRRRLVALEETATPASLEFPDWSIEDQIEDALDKLDFYRRFHTDGRIRYAATDREITMLGIAHAGEELQVEGEFRLPYSGTTIRFVRDDEDTFSVDMDGVVVVEDLPEGVREHFKRMDPAAQPARDQRLYEMRQHDRGEVGS